MSSRRILLLGESKTGKTHLAGQIYGRIRAGQSAFGFRSQPASLKLLEEVLDSLTNGKSAGHTPSGQYGEIEFDLTDPGGDKLELVWPDYAGEQISDMVARRSIMPDWAARIESADRFMLLVRSSDAVARKSALFSEPSRERDLGSRRRTDRMPVQMRMVELLQMLERARTVAALDLPELDVLLTCADEMETINDPKEALARHMPMLASFIGTRWTGPRVRYWAISALGRQLRDDLANEEFAETGPVEQGWIIGQDGQKLKDLTLPFAITSSIP
ncbi:hypothetical protein [Euryhalocaulis caribicus]|uniref:TRAFAC clade GTPase domain-containing protein n=1 Tax=Euryhalocaulis caribicus TaxID=1161401 RepID=UPI0003B33073|nr:hypothetical protein [Euryhalocaulis caribicus]